MVKNNRDINKRITIMKKTFQLGLLFLGTLALSLTLATAEGKCGGDSKKEMKCADGKCTSGKKGIEKSDAKKEMKCADGKCGDAKKELKCQDGKCATVKGKCGQGKCG